MGNVVNLRLARKRRTRQAAEEKAEENRRLHGRTKNDRVQQQAERVSRDAFLDSHRLERPDRDSE